MGEVIQLQGDQRKDVQEFLVDKKEGLELDAKTIKVSHVFILAFDSLLTPHTRSMVSSYHLISRCRFSPGLMRDWAVVLHIRCLADAIPATESESVVDAGDSH